jgi:hypothetical protein
MSVRKENEGKQNGVQGALILPRMAADGGYLFECCHCSLTHRLDFAVSPERGLEMRVYYDAEATERARAEHEGWLDRPEGSGDE